MDSKSKEKYVKALSTSNYSYSIKANDVTRRLNRQWMDQYGAPEQDISYWTHKLKRPFKLGFSVASSGYVGVAHGAEQPFMDPKPPTSATGASAGFTLSTSKYPLVCLY